MRLKNFGATVFILAFLLGPQIIINAHADTIRVVIVGELNAVDSDIYGLDGARFRGTYVYDTESIAAPYDPDAPTDGNSATATWPMLYGHAGFSDRPNGLANVGAELSGTSVYNWRYGGVTQDSSETFLGGVSADIFGSYSGTADISTYIYRHDLNPSVDLWSYARLTTQAGYSDKIAGTMTVLGTNYYRISDALLESVSIIPLPPAVWLFGSALGLMGVMRRKIS